MYRKHKKKNNQGCLSQLVDGWLLVNQRKRKAHYSYSSSPALIRPSCRETSPQLSLTLAHKRTHAQKITMKTVIHNLDTLNQVPLQNRELCLHHRPGSPASHTRVHAYVQNPVFSIRQTGVGLIIKSLTKFKLFSLSLSKKKRSRTVK